MKKELIEVLQVQSESHNQHRMYAYIITQLKQINCTYYAFNECIYVTKGNAEFYPCVVSHMDTVHDIVEDLTVIEVNGNLTGFNSFTMEQTGIGGDDKVGIFIALQCLETFDNIKAVFFRDEETGCEGSYKPDKTFFKDCGFILQCDRKGNKDFITKASGVELSCKHFQKDIKKVLHTHGYKFASGMMTDVMALKESDIDCSMANISCGYYNPHCYNEYVNINDVANCLMLVKAIISTIQGKQYICLYKRSNVVKFYDYSYSKLDTAYDENDYFGYKKKQKQCCDCCGEVDKLEYVGEYNQDMCPQCIKSYVTPLRYEI